VNDRKLTALPEPPEPEQFQHLLLDLGYALERLGLALAAVGQRAADAAEKFGKLAQLALSEPPGEGDVELADTTLAVTKTLANYTRDTARESTDDRG
jgi:uroporphyrinogen-III synthase